MAHIFSNIPTAQQMARASILMKNNIVRRSIIVHDVVGHSDNSINQLMIAYGPVENVSHHRNTYTVVFERVSSVYLALENFDAFVLTRKAIKNQAIITNIHETITDEYMYCVIIVDYPDLLESKVQRTRGSPNGSIILSFNSSVDTFVEDINEMKLTMSGFREPILAEKIDFVARHGLSERTMTIEEKSQRDQVLLNDCKILDQNSIIYQSWISHLVAEKLEIQAHQKEMEKMRIEMLQKVNIDIDEENAELIRMEKAETRRREMRHQQLKLARNQQVRLRYSGI